MLCWRVCAGTCITVQCHKPTTCPLQAQHYALSPLQATTCPLQRQHHVVLAHASLSSATRIPLHAHSKPNTMLQAHYELLHAHYNANIMMCWHVCAGTCITVQCYKNPTTCPPQAQHYASSPLRATTCPLQRQYHVVLARVCWHMHHCPVLQESHYMPTTSPTLCFKPTTSYYMPTTTPISCCAGTCVLASVVHFTVDAVNRHLTVRRNLRFGPSETNSQA
jgi:hypothetical protein